MPEDEFMPPVQTRRVSRANLAKFLPNAELIKQFEQMVSDVSEVLPISISESASAADAASVAADQALSIAAGARGDIGRLLAALAETNILLRLQRDPHAGMQRMQLRITELENTVLALQRAASLDTLRQQIDELRTIILGA